MIAEMHCHTSEHSACSHVAAADLACRACEGGIQALVITDHHYLWSPEELADLRREVELPSIFVLLAGQEVNTADYGHILFYGAKETIEPDDDMTLARIRGEHPKAAVIWAHPYRQRNSPPPEKLLSPLHDGIEIFNSNHTLSESARALKDWHRYRFTAIGGTDTHGVTYIGMYPTVFDHPFHTLEEMVEEIKHGRCRPYFREIPFTGTSNTTVTQLTLGPRSTRTRREIILKTFENPEDWREGERTHRIIEAMLNCGFGEGRFRVPRPLEKDEDLLTLVEEKVTGRTVYQCMAEAGPSEASRYLELAAEWLARLHNTALHLTPVEEYLRIEPGRLDFYLSSLEKTDHRFLARVREIKNRVLELEQDLIRSRPELLVQGHGDYHPKNIYIGEDPAGGEYVCPIDFQSSYQLPRAFDVGTFLAQYINIFFSRPEVRRHTPADIFLKAYLARAADLESDFMDHVALYKARTCLSILYYLAKVRMGESPNFWRIMIEAERNLNLLRSRQIGRPSDR